MPKQSAPGQTPSVAPAPAPVAVAPAPVASAPAAAPAPPPAVAMAPAPAPAPPPAVVAQPASIPPPPAAAIVDEVSAAMAASVPSNNGTFDSLGSIDMTNVDDSSNRLLPDGQECETVIHEVALEKSKAGGDMVALTLKVVWPEEFRGTTIWDYVTLAPNTLWKFKSLCRACEQLSEDGSRFIGQSVDEFKDYLVRFTVVHDEYQNRKKNKVGSGYIAAYECREAKGTAQG